MARAQPEIDRLLDEGLTCYGRGDLDGALASWQRVLGIDPQHEQALGYLDYVRMNYELLSSGVAAPEAAAAAAAAAGEGGSGSGSGSVPAQPVAVALDSAPFAIGDPEPGYVIQVEQGELPEGSAAPRIIVAPDGWAIEDEEAAHRRQTLPRLTFDAPPPSGPESQISPFDAAPGEPGEPTGISFDDATKEYDGPARLSASALDDGMSQEFRIDLTPTPGFDSSGDTHTPTGFGTQRTEIRRRDLGFVQAVSPRPAGSTPGLSGPPEGRAPTAPELPIQPIESPFDPSPDVDPPTIERSPLNPLTAELLASLPGAPPGTRELSPPRAPIPRAGPAGTRSTIEGLPPVRTSTLPALPALPPSPTAAGRIPVIPPPPPSPAEPLARGGPHEFESPTERKDPRSPSAAELAQAVGSTREAPLAGGARPRPDANPLISAPTRDLGLRQSAAALAEAEDDPTMTAGTLALPRASTLNPSPTATHNDIVLPFDPIGARSAHILDAIDRRSPAPPDEPREDRTRRRIAALFEHAIEWSRAGELDRAVTAVDLALSEDPNSALAQKLIHRNRETIMSVFQGFLGDLHRTPVLARPLHELASSPISPRAAFLLSRVDGLLSLDEILDVSGMPSMEAYRYLCQLFLRGILR